MRNNRQLVRKQSSLSHPSTSLHLVQISKLLQQYQHSRLLYNINLNTSAVQQHLVLKQQKQQSYDILTDVPYVQSEHYDSNQTFVEQEESSDEECFTDEQGKEQEENAQVIRKGQKKISIQLEESDQEYRPQDFYFVPKNGSKNSKATFAQSGTVHTESQELRQAPLEIDSELFELQQTACFTPLPDYPVDRRLSYGSNKQNSSISVLNSTISKKAMFLNKIQQQKSRKQIAEDINRERHHLKKFLK